MYCHKIYPHIAILPLIILAATLIQSIECLSSAQETRCLSCIRNITTTLQIDVNKRCNESPNCGPYQISYTYWTESGKPATSSGLRDHEKCARDKNCAEQAVRAYFKKFKRDCNHDGNIDCLDMIALHKAGPSSCSSDWFYKSRYWLAVNKTACAAYPNADYPDPQDGELSVKLRPDPPSIAPKNQSLTNECLDCICEGISGCNSTLNNCSSGTVCGPFAISQAYWKDGRRPGASWTACTRTKECSSVTVKNYMEKYKKDCDGDGVITCEDYAAIHRRGPRACSSKDLLREQYWTRFAACRANQKPANDMNLVKVDDRSDDSSKNQISSVGRDDMSLSTQKQAVNGLQESVPQTQPSTSTVKSTSSDQDLKEPRLPYEPTSSSTFSKTSIQYDSPASAIEKPQDQRDSHGFQVSQAPSIPAVDDNQAPVIVIAKPISWQAPHLPDSSSIAVQPTETPAVQVQRPQQQAEIAPNPGVIDLPIGEESDYPSPDFSLASGASPNGSRRNNFDHVVHGIVKSPDFSKSYPPVPEIVVQEKPTNEAQSMPESPQLHGLSSKSHQKVNTNHSRSPVNKSPLSDANPVHTSSHKSSNNISDQKSGPQSSFNDQPAHSSNPETPAGASTDPILSQDILSLSMFQDAKDMNESSLIASECLECICDASSNCDKDVQCVSKQREKNRCGMYMISWNQYQESDISTLMLPSSGNRDSLDARLYRECSTDKNCAVRLINLYIEKHQRDCNGDGKIDCSDIAAIHRVGPDSCNSDKFLSSQYWKDFNSCYSSLTTAATTTLAPSAPDGS